MGGKHARAAPLRGPRLVRMLVFRTIVSTAVLAGSLYAGLSTGERIVAYRMRHDRPAATCMPGLSRPEGQLAAAQRHHRRAAALPECYHRPLRQLVQLDVSYRSAWSDPRK
jgi:hypothetical protein